MKKLLVVVVALGSLVSFNALADVVGCPHNTTSVSNGICHPSNTAQASAVQIPSSSPLVVVPLVNSGAKR